MKPNPMKTSFLTIAGALSLLVPLAAQAQSQNSLSTYVHVSANGSGGCTPMFYDNDQSLVENVTALTDDHTVSNENASSVGHASTASGVAHATVVANAYNTGGPCVGQGR